MQRSKDISRLIEIMAALRTPVTGCPWDLEQDFNTIAPYTIEEAYEVADAIGRGNLDDLKDELGDLLLQVVYHARMAEEQGAFRFEDVVEAITAKMIRRHPHVFGDEETRDAGAVKGFWERIKAEENAAKAESRASNGDSRNLSGHAGARTLANVPLALPALTRAQKLQQKAARVGFDWNDRIKVIDKIEEEIGELRAAEDAADIENVEEEIGDLLFALVNYARHHDIDAEQALRSANTKFTSRFGHVEKRLAAGGSSPEKATLDEMETLWQEAKKSETA